MRSGASASLSGNPGQGLQAFLWRQAGRILGLGLISGVVLGVCALATWNVADPSFSHATGNEVTNAIGYPGAVFADLAMQFFGLSAVAALVPAVIWGMMLASGHFITRAPKRGIAWFAGAIIAAGVAGCFAPPPTWPLPTGLGGVFGDMVLKLPSLFIGAYPTGLAGMIIAMLLLAPALALLAFASGIIARGPGPVREKEQRHEEVVDDEDEEGERASWLAMPLLVMGSLTHSWYTMRAFFRRKMSSWQDRKAADLELTRQERGGWRRAAQQVDLAEMQEGRVSSDGRARVEPEFFAQMVSGQRVEPRMDEAFGGQAYDDAGYDDGQDSAPFDMDDDNVSPPAY
ncbi:cell division protein FtsK, partial [Salmonella enterica subsp. enterica]|nr:cell division protein FtsK [Salmonella enterica subsp. enterica serovar Paratyphi A]